MFALLTLLVTFGLVCAILIPGDRARRGERTRRVVAVAAAYSLAMGVAAVVAGTRTDLSVISTILRWAITFPLHLIGFGFADRVAVFLGARRNLPWALGAVALAIAWTAAINFLLLGVEIASVSASDLAFGLLLPAAVAGLVWYAMLVDRREQVRAIFE